MTGEQLQDIPTSMSGAEISGFCNLPQNTVRGVLKRAQETLIAAGVPEPEADAQVLVAHVLGVDRLNLFLNMDRVLSSAEEKTLAGLILERTKRMPLQHILGEQEFWSLSFKVTPEVLIPRPETEILVEAVLNTVKKQGIPPDDGLTILDLCTGSGILAVVLARELPGVDIYAVDISKEALSVAMENARRHNVLDSITFLQGDLFAPLADQGVSFDLIVSNPPYISGEMFPGLLPEVRDYEPRLALDGGPDGLDVIRKIIGQSVAHLKIGGWLFLEIGDGQGREVLKEFERRKAFENVSIIRDYCGIDRVIRAQRIN
ncbi:MAG: peptide chain release factor N(5)-glutamine methyltransferase [Thermodesulfobacteriota bacterium]|nr:peptide chain release factor N(5)-glutamine methyltransferase [Thermodesulfobacteriota bacterium]